MSRESVMKLIREKDKRYSIKILGNKKDKEDGFYIITSFQIMSSDASDVYHGLLRGTLDLLDSAEIKYAVIK